MQPVLAIYENGVLRPLAPLALAEHSIVHLEVGQSMSDHDSCQRASGPTLDEFDELLDQLATDGAVVSGTFPRDDIYIDHD
jgi:predicted DNA-binding antitoxin AbrB/MazE fold protein